MNSRFIVLIFTLLVISSCAKITKQVSNVNDYNNYLELAENITLQKAQEENNFWKEKFENQPSQTPYLGKIAASYSHLFAVTGEIEYLKKAEEEYLEANKIANYKNPGLLKALATNYISQHKFKEALELLDKAELIGDQLESTQKMIFDVQLELGSYDLAKLYLDKFENMSDFDYLIRLAKWNDHQGNLDAAIRYLEKAKDIAESSNVRSAKLWIYTNLGDFYGHAGNIEASYNHFLKALEIDPDDAYAKKGIAWIVYSYEKNADEALRILKTVSKQNMSPSYNLIKAEIYDFKGDVVSKEKELKLYEEAVKDSSYGNMYNKYNVLLYTDEKANLQKAIEISKTEVKNRPTPESYDLLAWSYFANGDISQAYQIASMHVKDKTFHPEALYHTAEIYKAVGKSDEVKEIKKELSGSLYELGPLVAKKVELL